MEICIKNKKRPGGVAQVVEHLPNKREALSSNYSADKKKKKERKAYTGVLSMSVRGLLTTTIILQPRVGGYRNILR
jgi:hypothetical protein